jgi:hypothetical protein
LSGRCAGLYGYGHTDEEARMMSAIRGWRTLGIMIAATALIVAVAGIAHAVTSAGNKVIDACVRTGDGQLRVASPGACRQSERRLSWNRRGPVGPLGPRGQPGVSGSERVAARVTINPGARSEVTATCPAGKKVLGGGFIVQTPIDVQVFYSAPSVGGNFVDNAWAVFARNRGTVGPRQVTAIAICASVPS